MSLNFEEFYQDYLDTLAAYNMAASIIYSDQATVAPRKGIPYSNKMMSILSERAFEVETDPEIVARIKEYAQRLPEGSLEKKEVLMRLEEIAKTEKIPPKEYARYVKAKGDAEYYWNEAKTASDYEMFKPHLKSIMDETMNILRYDPRFTQDNAYDLQLDAYEKGMNQEKYDAFFQVIKEELVPFIARLHEEGIEIDDSILNQEFDVKKQAELADALLDYLKVDPGKVYLGTTEHPFTNFISHNDVRITTHYYPNRLISAVLSTIHEYGHALYALQINEDYDGTSLKDSIGSAAHESQSRFLENHIGRSLPFWKAIYPVLQEKFPMFKDLAVEDVYKMVNTTRNSLIRTEADELTYPLHILIRYELEKDIASGKADYDTLDQAWADKYEEYLGVRPADAASGILQDVHWSTGYLGYFPTYALGSALAAQLYQAMAQSMDVDQVIAQGKFDEIAGWLEENVHRCGAEKTMMEIVEEVSGKPFDPHIYTQYLKDKYASLYQLDR